MTKRRKILIAIGAVLGVPLAALLVLPLLLKDQIAERVRGEIDGALDARVEWSGFGLSFFRDFPNLTVRLDGLDVTGVDAFDGERLASVGAFRLALDLGSVIGALRRGESVVVRSVRLDEPDVRLRVLEDGTANWHIMREDSTGASGAPEGAGEEPEEGVEDGPAAGPDEGPGLRITLQELAVEGATLVLDDERSGLSAALEGLSHSLSGDFGRDRSLMRTRTRAEAATVRFGGVPYLDGVALDLEANVDANLADGQFTLEDNELRLNDLAVSFSGEAARSADGLALDVVAAAPQADFRQILSLVPAVHRRDFESLEADGDVSMDGWVRGTLGEEAFPAFAMEIAVDDGQLQYPDLPLPARAIAARLSATNPGGDLDSTAVTLDPFHVEIGGEPLDGTLAVRTPVSDPALDLRVQGALDLADLPRTLPLQTVEELAGTVTADASVRARMSDIEARRAEQIDARGTVSARDVAVRGADLRHAVDVEAASLTLSPSAADLSELVARVGSSDFEGSGRLDNLLGYALRDEALEGTATVRSRHLDLDEWRSDEPDREVVPVPDRVDLTLDVTVDELVYNELVMNDARGTVRVRDRRVTLEDVRGTSLGGSVGVNGFYETVEADRPTFGIDLALEELDIAQAAASLLTVQTLAPVARYAQGTFSTDLRLDGTLGADMTPLFDALSGQGLLGTSTVVLEDFPVLERLADALRIRELESPTLQALSSSVAIRDGRLHVRPFEVAVGDLLTMNVGGSTGVDRSLDYTLAVAVPRSLLGAEADRVVQDLVARAGAAGLELQPDDVVQLDVRVTGTVDDPTVQPDFAGVAQSAGDRLESAALAEAAGRFEEVEEQADQAREEARARTQARADSIVAEAEERAEQIREQARATAQEVRDEGERRAQEVLDRATNPVAQAAARPVAERIRQEANEAADEIVAEADERADQIVAEARARADAVREGGGGAGNRA